MLRAMPRLILGGLVAAAALAAPATAAAGHVSCRVGYYSPGADTASPTVTSLRAHNLPRKTDGYAPRCLVAEAIVGEDPVPLRGRAGSCPRRLWIYGARWNGGRWRCSYPAGRAVCRRIGKPSRRVTMDLAT